MILIIDNYDSFTFNLVHYLGALVGSLDELMVCRNDQISLNEIIRADPSHIVISPGPCTPNESGISLELIHEFTGAIPILGVCLGHQAIGQVFGGKVVRAPLPFHGKTSEIFHNGRSVFDGLSSPFTATRYHSLILERASLPDALTITAETKDGLIMGVEHREYPTTAGVQFHPESIMTEVGHLILRNFLAMGRRPIVIDEITARVLIQDSRPRSEITPRTCSSVTPQGQPSRNPRERNY